METLLNAFDFDGEVLDIQPFGNGHINDTFLVKTTKQPYIIQRINHHVFKQPEQLMYNYRLVTTYLKERIQASGGNLHRETISIVPTKDQRDFYVTKEGNYYRSITFIEDSICLDTIKNAKDCFATGKTFGNFQALLEGFDATKLYETIPNFHHTPKRYEAFLEALQKASPERIENAQAEIEFIQSHQADIHALYDAHLPVKVTHNDTKLNNILFDKHDMRPLCVIDLDTIMPGFVANDFGDCIRSGATYSREDEPDLDKVTLELDLYQNYLDGFIEGAKATLTKEEIRSLPKGAKTITLEQAIRFLTDYLEGDHYYKIDYPQHNLVRTKTQIKLVKEMEKYQKEIDAMLQKHLAYEKDEA